MSAPHLRPVMSELWALVPSENYVGYSNTQPGLRIVVLYHKKKKKKNNQTNMPPASVFSPFKCKESHQIFTDLFKGLLQNYFV